jgi:uncharacterized protein (DUF1015 family)
MCSCASIEVGESCYIDPCPEELFLPQPEPSLPLIRPFRALRYGHDHLEQLAELVSPCAQGMPTDPSEIGEVSPHNIRRLVRGDFGELAASDEPQFTHAARLLARWKADGVLVRDSRPSFYVSEERWEGGFRRGLVALVRLSPLEDGQVLPHEATAGRSEQTLAAQLAVTDAQLSMVLSIVPDAAGALQQFLAEDRGNPDYWTTDGSGLKTGVWHEADPHIQLDLIEALRDEVAVIADGHHRYRAALVRQAGLSSDAPPSSRETPVDYVMMMLIPAEEPGLRCSSTHRVCPVLGPTARRVLTESATLFDEQPLADAAELHDFLRSDDGYRFGQVLDGKISGLRVRPDASVDLPFPLSTVDSAVLAHLLVDRLEEATAEGWTDVTTSGSSGSPFSHNHSSAEEVLAEALRGELDLALFLRPPTAAQIFAVASAGQRLPPKSTNFTPKPTKGLLMASLRSF